MKLAEWDFQRRYGSWDPFSPAQVLDLLGDAPFVWWIAGGWSLEFDDAPVRRHEDVDVVVLRRDLDAVRERLAGWHLWEAHQGALRPLLPGEEPRVDREQWWVRRDAWSPWVLDVLLTPSEGDDWLFKKDHRVRRPLDSMVRRGADGVPYQVPEVTLLYKALLERQKDVADLQRAWPRLGAQGRRWLREALEVSRPSSGWLPRLHALDD
jgi:aminoglycoside-2''-adenylyltransferase